MTFLLIDHKYMARAIKLAQQGRYTTTPNPNVGCVVVNNGNIIGEGWHKKAGFGHAEVNALEGLSLSETDGATAYVTLEPCSHYGRTPPCAKRLINAQVKRVVIAMLDPNPKVAGRGVEMLEKAGIKVEVGVLETDARALNPGFFSQMERQRPFIDIKLASSLDGKTALHNGESKWITGPAARADVQKYRAQSCAIISTANTVLRDNARLDVRAEQLPFDYPIDNENTVIRQPVRVILDGQNQIQGSMCNQLALFSNGGKVVLIKSSPTKEFAQVPNVEVVTLPYQSNQGFDLKSLLNWCHQQQINYLWVEAGAGLASSFVAEQLFDRLIMYIAPKLLGKNSFEVMPIGPFDQMSDTTELTLHSVTQLDQDLKLIYTLKS